MEKSGGHFRTGGRALVDGPEIIYTDGPVRYRTFQALLVPILPGWFKVSKFQSFQDFRIQDFELSVYPGLRAFSRFKLMSFKIV